jgi:hypothetical protein
MAKRTPEEIFPEDFRFVRNLEWLRRYRRKNNREVAEAAGLSVSCLYARKKEPWNFHSAEQQRIAEFFGETRARMLTEEFGDEDYYQGKSVRGFRAAACGRRVRIVCP